MFQNSIFLRSDRKIRIYNNRDKICFIMHFVIFSCWNFHTVKICHMCSGILVSAENSIQNRFQFQIIHMGRRMWSKLPLERYNRMLFIFIFQLLEMVSEGYFSWFSYNCYTSELNRNCSQCTTAICGNSKIDFLLSFQSATAQIRG